MSPSSIGENMDKKEMRKQNRELANQLREAKKSIKNISENSEEKKRIEKLTSELEELKNQYIDILKNLNKDREKYTTLIGQLKLASAIMKKKGFKLPWYKRLKIKLKQKIKKKTNQL